MVILVIKICVYGWAGEEERNFAQREGGEKRTLLFQ